MAQGWSYWSTVRRVRRPVPRSTSQTSEVPRSRLAIGITARLSSGDSSGVPP